MGLRKLYLYKVGHISAIAPTIANILDKQNINKYLCWGMIDPNIDQQHIDI